MQSTSDSFSGFNSALSEAVATDEAAPFFAVSPTKLALLYFCSGGLYGSYWFYKNWSMLKARDNSERNSMPLLRAGLATFLAIFLFQSMRATGRKLGRFVVPFSPVQMAGGFFLTNTISGLLSDAFPPLAILALFGFVFLLPVQHYANQVNAEVVPNIKPNNRLTRHNWLLIALCLPVVLFWCCIQFGLVS